MTLPFQCCSCTEYFTRIPGLLCFVVVRYRSISLQWHHNERDGVSNNQPHDCLLNLLFKRRSKKTSKFRVTGLCEGNSPVTGEFPAQRASNAENVSIWWRHVTYIIPDYFTGTTVLPVSTKQHWRIWVHMNPPGTAILPQQNRVHMTTCQKQVSRTGTIITSHSICGI